MHASSLLDSAATPQQGVILSTLLSYAAGDAFGVAYEYLPERIPVDIGAIGTRANWPAGGVSDDTLLSLLTIHAVRVDDPAESADTFLRDVLAAVPGLRGLGPTTRAALGLPGAPDEGLVVVGHTVIGNTNGGMMRTSLLGLGYGPDGDAERRSMVTALTRVTHKAPPALSAALACSALFSRALLPEPEPVSATLAREFDQVGDSTGELVDWTSALDAWEPPSAGISLDPLETLAAVLWVTDRAESILDAFRLACVIGGDTDTVAALSGGLICARTGGAGLLDIPWIDDVRWSEIPDVVMASEELETMRGSR